MSKYLKIVLTDKAVEYFTKLSDCKMNSMHLTKQQPTVFNIISGTPQEWCGDI